MKKQLCLILVTLNCAIFSSAQDNSKSPALGGGKTMTVDEANRLNGVVQPTINGKSYNQYKAEQDALKQQAMANKQGGANRITPLSASPNAPKPVQSSPKQKDNNETQKPASVPAITEAAVVQQTVPAPKVPSSLRIPEAKEWTGRAVTGDRAMAAIVAMPKSDPGQPFTGEDLSAAKPAAKPAAEKPAKRDPAEIEKAKQLQEQAAKVKVANEKQATSAPSTAPELKVDTSTENAAPVNPASKPPVAPPAGKQD